MEAGRALAVVGAIVSFIGLFVLPILVIDAGPIHMELRLFDTLGVRKQVEKIVIETAHITDLEVQLGGNRAGLFLTIFIIPYVILSLLSFIHRAIAITGSIFGLFIGVPMLNWYGDLVLPGHLSDIAMRLGIVKPGIGIYIFLVGVLIMLAGGIIGYPKKHEKTKEAKKKKIPPPPPPLF